MAKTKYPMKFTEADFESMGWHDNYIHAISFEPEKYSFSLLIGYIHQWVMEEGRDFKFAISPARLSFENVSGLRLAVDFAGCLPEMSIGAIEMTNPRPTINGKLTEYDFRITLNWPDKGGEISFSATGFSQKCLAPAELYDEQKLPVEASDKFFTR